MACSTFGRGNKENLYNIFPFLFVPVHYQQIAIIDFIFHYCFGEPISVRSSGSNTQCIRLENEKDTHVNMNFGEHEPKWGFLVWKHARDALKSVEPSYGILWIASVHITYMNVLHKPFYMIKLITAKWIDNEKCANPGSHIDVLVCSLQYAHRNSNRWE